MPERLPQGNDLLQRLSEIEKGTLLQWATSFEKETQDRYAAAKPDFEKVYGPSSWDQDMANLAISEEQFKQRGEADPHGKILEYLVARWGYLWLPGKVTQASRFDDVKRKTDLFLEVQTAPGVWLPVAIDVTTKQSDIISKFSDATDEIRAGRLHEVRYFIPASGVEGITKNPEMPRLVLGIDRPAIDRLGKKIMDYNFAHHAKQTERAKEILTELKQDPAGLVLLDEILRELDRFLIVGQDIPESHGQKQSILERLTKMRNGFSRILKIKGAPKGSQDEVYQAVLEAAAA